MSRYTSFHCAACNWTGWRYVNTKNCPDCGEKLVREDDKRRKRDGRKPKRREETSA